MRLFEPVKVITFRSTKQVRCPRKGEWIQIDWAIVKADSDFEIDIFEIFERTERTVYPGGWLIALMIAAVCLIWASILIRTGGA